MSPRWGLKIFHAFQIRISRSFGINLSGLLLIKLAPAEQHVYRNKNKICKEAPAEQHIYRKQKEHTKKLHWSDIYSLYLIFHPSGILSNGLMNFYKHVTPQRFVFNLYCYKYFVALRFNYSFSEGFGGFFLRIFSVFFFEGFIPFFNRRINESSHFFHGIVKDRLV